MDRRRFLRRTGVAAVGAATAACKGIQVTKTVLTIAPTQTSKPATTPPPSATPTPIRLVGTEPSGRFRVVEGIRLSTLDFGEVDRVIPPANPADLTSDLARTLVQVYQNSGWCVYTATIATLEQGSGWGHIQQIVQAWAKHDPTNKQDEGTPRLLLWGDDHQFQDITHPAGAPFVIDINQHGVFAGFAQVRQTNLITAASIRDQPGDSLRPTHMVYTDLQEASPTQYNLGAWDSHADASGRVYACRSCYPEGRGLWLVSDWERYYLQWVPPQANLGGFLGQTRMKTALESGWTQEDLSPHFITLQGSGQVTEMHLPVTAEGLYLEGHFAVGDHLLSIYRNRDKEIIQVGIESGGRTIPVLTGTEGILHRFAQSKLESMLLAGATNDGRILLLFRDEQGAVLEYTWEDNPATGEINLKESSFYWPEDPDVRAIFQQEALQRLKIQETGEVYLIGGMGPDIKIGMMQGDKFHLIEHLTPPGPIG